MSTRVGLRLFLASIAPINYNCCTYKWASFPSMKASPSQQPSSYRVLVLTEGHTYRRAFFPNIRRFFRAIFHSSIFSYFSCFPNIGMLTDLIFLVLENFTNSDGTPPYIVTYFQLFPNFFEIMEKTLSDKNEPECAVLRDNVTIRTHSSPAKGNFAKMSCFFIDSSGRLLPTVLSPYSSLAKKKKNCALNGCN